MFFGLLRVWFRRAFLDFIDFIDWFSRRIYSNQHRFPPGSTFLPEQGRPKNQEKMKKKIDEKSHPLQISLFDFLPLVKS
jgi:hypothetical protein